MASLLVAPIQFQVAYWQVCHKEKMRFLEYYKQVIYLEYLSKKCNLRVYHSLLPTQSLFYPCGQNSTYKTGNHISFVKFVFVNVWFLYDKDF